MKFKIGFIFVLAALCLGTGFYAGSYTRNGITACEDLSLDLYDQASGLRHKLHRCKVEKSQYHNKFKKCDGLIRDIFNATSNKEK